MSNPGNSSVSPKGDQPAEWKKRRSIFGIPLGRSKDATTHTGDNSGFARRFSFGSKPQGQVNLNKASPTLPTEQRPASPPPAYEQATDQLAIGQVSGASPVLSRYKHVAHPAISAAAASTEEDPYAFLSSFDTIFLIDDSTSMRGASWQEVNVALSCIAPICASHDLDGVDVFFLNHKTNVSPDPQNGLAGTGYRGVTTIEQVQRIFAQIRPNGATPTGQRLNNIFRPYLRHYDDRIKKTGDETCLKPLNIIVLTDGQPTDELEEVIIQCAKKLDALEAPPYQIGIQFFQVGNMRDAAAALQRLDDVLPQQNPGMRDIVDTVTFDGGRQRNAMGLTRDGILKVVLGSVVKRLDRVKSNLR